LSQLILKDAASAYLANPVTIAAKVSSKKLLITIIVVKHIQNLDPLNAQEYMYIMDEDKNDFSLNDWNAIVQPIVG
jgi:hypothetical protein